MSKTVALLLTFACVCMIAGGQIMFKLVADKGAASPGASMVDQWLTWPFIAALVIYGIATILWVWVLRFIPLSVAYPVFALAFLIVPIAAHFFLNEAIGIRHFVGGGLIMAGVFVIAKG